MAMNSTVGIQWYTFQLRWLTLVVCFDLIQLAFFNEVYDSLLRGIEEHLIAEDLTLEINSSK